MALRLGINRFGRLVTRAVFGDKDGPKVIATDDPSKRVLDLARHILTVNSNYTTTKNMKVFQKTHQEGQKVLEEAINRISPYFNQANDDRKRIVKLASPEELAAIIDFETKKEPISGEQLMAEVDKVLEYSVMTQHKRFHNQLFSQSTPEGLAGELLSGVSNASMYTYEVAPVFLVMENRMLKRFREYIGWENGDGILTPGGSLSNFYGMSIARHRRWPESKKQGSYACGPVAIFVSRAGHYSIKKAAFFMGFGTDSVYECDFDENYGICQKSLRENIKKAKAEGRTPFMLVATIGTTVFGSFDNMEMLGALAKEENMWLHMDACLGANMLVSEKHKHLVKGSHLADSSSWNPHKALGVPQQCAMFITKHENLLSQAHSTRAAYLFQPDKLYAEMDTGDKSIQCGRKMDILKIWMTFKIQGESGIADRVDRMQDLANYLREQIVKRGETDGSFKLVSPGYMFNTTFWVIPPSARGPNAPPYNSKEWREKVHNAAIVAKERMQEHGTCMIGFQSVPIVGDESPPNFFRFALANPHLKNSDMDYILDMITEYVSDL